MHKCYGDPSCGCDNWDMVREFTNAFIDGIDESGKVNQFAVVRFASTAGKQVRHYIISVADGLFCGISS